MKMLIDHAAINVIRHIYEFYPIDGVTTNPSILAENGCQPYDTLKEIRSFIGKDADLHVQTVAPGAFGMIADAERICRELGDNTLVKIPCTPDGFKAMRELCKEGIRLTGTDIYTPMQAYLAAQCGAEYASLYVNCADDVRFDGMAFAKGIQELFAGNGFKTQVLATSFRNSKQVLALSQHGIGAAAVTADVMEEFLENPATNATVNSFVVDFWKLTGAGKMMSNC